MSLYGIDGGNGREEEKIMKQRKRKKDRREKWRSTDVLGMKRKDKE